MKYLFKLVGFFSFFVLFLFNTSFCKAVDNVYPEYEIQQGDFLSVVAVRFNTSVDEIISINQISDPNTISIGDKIKIPSLKGLSGTVSTENINIGQTLSNISITSGIRPADILKMNHVVSLSEIYIGSTLMIVKNTNGKIYNAVDVIERSETWLEKSAIVGQNPATLAEINQVHGNWDLAEKQLVYSQSDTQTSAASKAISPLLDLLEIKQLPITQGETHVIHLKSKTPLLLSGQILGQNLTFYQDETSPSDWYAFFAADAMQDTGLSTITLNGTTEDGKSFEISQQAIVEPGYFTYETVIGVDASTLEDHSNQVDRDAVAAITQTLPRKQWGDHMSYPVDEPCLVSAFGNRRTYNDGSFTNFHSGVDYGVCTANNINIYAAADGEVLYAAELPIHGNYTIIDHGWGVYSTYSHQSTIQVTVGQHIKRGELIGQIGSTGRSVGPHLHWEIKINGVYVNPLTWLKTTFP